MQLQRLHRATAGAVHGARVSRRLGLVATAAAISLPLAGCAGATPPVPAPSPWIASAGAPPIRHVFVIVLENESYGDVFRANTSLPYLGGALAAHGVLLRQYFAIGHASADNYVAMISGQAPDPATHNDCTTYSAFTGSSRLDAQGQVHGDGCVYPSSVKTIADQLAALGETWKGYMEDMGNDPRREASTCGHPQLGRADGTQGATATDQYAARHDPFVYFRSIIDDPVSCDENVVGLSALLPDLASTATTPNLGVVVPNLCNDGHDDPCVGTNLSGTHDGGGSAVESWLSRYVPLILQSPAFQQDGMLVVTFDEAENGDATACCGEAPGPNVQEPGQTGPGGGRVGAVVVSPLIPRGRMSDVAYNHYALLRTVEDLLSVRTGGSDGQGHLGEAGRASVHPFGRDVYGR